MHATFRSLAQFCNGFVMRLGLAKRPVVCKSAVHIDDTHDLGTLRNRVATQPVGIARAIPVFLVVTDDRQHGFERLERRADVTAHARMLVKQGPLARSQGAGLFQNRVRDGDLAHVVQDGSVIENLYFLRIHAEGFCQHNGIVGHLFHVPA